MRERSERKRRRGGPRAGEGRPAGMGAGKSQLGRGVGPVRERMELGWARGKGRSGPVGKGGLIGLGFALGWFLALGFLSISPFLFLVQTNTKLGEFKFKFEFTTSTQTNKRD